MWTPLRAEPSEARTRATLVIIEPNIAWMGLNWHAREMLEAEGFVTPKGKKRLSPLQAISATSDDDCYLHVTLDRPTAIRYAECVDACVLAAYSRTIAISSASAGDSVQSRPA